MLEILISALRLSQVGTSPRRKPNGKERRMNDYGVDKSRSKAEKESLEWKFKIVAEGFRELFDLLQQYAPVWYTEEQHKRALAVRRIIEKSRGAAAT